MINSQTLIHRHVFGAYRPIIGSMLQELCNESRSGPAEMEHGFMRRVQHTVGLVAPNYVQSSLRSTFALWASDPYGPDDDDDDDDDDDEGDDDDDDDEDPPPEPCIGDEPDECAPVV